MTGKFRRCRPKGHIPTLGGVICIMPDITFEERNLINEFKQKSKWVCRYCRKNISNKEELTVDHKIPMSRGGLTEESNLAISCLKCNKEKDNMTEEEYLEFKQKQQSLLENLDLSEQVNQLFTLYNQIISDANTANTDYFSSEKQIQVLENNIATTNFNLYQGYLLAKELKEAILRRNMMKTRKEAYNTLHTLIGSNKKQLSITQEKITENVLSDHYNLLKQSCMKKLEHEQEDKVIDMHRHKSVNE